MRFPLGNFRTNTVRFFAVLLCLSLGLNITMAQRTLDSSKTETSKSETPSFPTNNLAPTPFVLPGNPECSLLNSLHPGTGPNAGAVSHIVDDFGLKIDVESPNFANVPFNNGSSPARILQGGAAPDVTRTVSMTTTGNQFNWSSTKQITAVIVKGGPNGANVYPYNPFSFGEVNGGGTGLITPGGFGVSHVVFCFGVGLVPSSGGVSLSGRTLTAAGMPIRGTTMELWNVTRNEYHIATTSSFGYYVFNDLPAADFYVLTANHGRYTFADNTRSFTLNDDLAEIDFFQDH